jgi:hypothetical protein
MGGIKTTQNWLKLFEKQQHISKMVTNQQTKPKYMLWNYWYALVDLSWPPCIIYQWNWSGYNCIITIYSS